MLYYFFIVVNFRNPDKHVGFGKNERGCDDPYSGIDPSRCLTPESTTTDSEAQGKEALRFLSAGDAINL